MKSLTIGIIKNLLEKTKYNVKINLFNSGIIIDSEILRELLLKILKERTKK